MISSVKELIIIINGVENTRKWAISFAQQQSQVEDFLRTIGTYKVCEIYDTGLIYMTFAKDIRSISLKQIRKKLKTFDFQFRAVRKRSTLLNPGKMLAKYENGEQGTIYVKNIPFTEEAQNEEDYSNSLDNDVAAQLDDIAQDMEKIMLGYNAKIKSIQNNLKKK